MRVDGEGGWRGWMVRVEDDGWRGWMARGMVRVEDDGGWRGGW